LRQVRQRRRAFQESAIHCFAPLVEKREKVQKVMKRTLVFAVAVLFALDTNAGTQEQLETCRRQIDSLDQRIVDLLQERARVVGEVGKIKRAANQPVTVPGREQQVIAKAEEFAKNGPLPAEAMRRIYQKVVEEMRNWEAEQSVATPTP
jgi:chorismate mutase-like protein